MKNIKRILALLLALSLFAGVLFSLASCGTPEPEDEECTSHVDNNGDGICDTEGCGKTVTAGGDIKYTITVKDYYGNAYEGVAPVEIFKGEESVGMARISGGSASKTLPRDTYTFTLDFDGEYVYDQTLAVLTPDAPTAEIVIYNSIGAPQTLVIPCNHRDENNDCICDSCSLIRHLVDENSDGVCDDCGTAKHEDKNSDGICDDTSCRCQFVYLPYENGGYSAHGISVGASIVTIDRPEMSYFVFTPEESGVYKFTCIADGEFVFGNYGDPNYIQRNSTVTVVDGSFESIVPEGALGSGSGGRLHMVIGVASESAKTAVIVIEKQGEAPEQIPYTEITADKNKEKYDDILNDGLVDIDVTEKVTVVLNEDDGYYHYGSAAGPLVLVKISVGGNSNLFDFTFPSFVTVCETGKMCCFFYDGAGELVSKELYNPLISDYSALAGSRGLIPLDEKIANAIKNTGEHNGWWKKTGEGANYIFGSNNVNAESAWLFACAYLSPYEYGSSVSPIVVSPSAEAVDNVVRVSADDETVIRVYSSDGKGADLTFAFAEGITVNVGGTSYTADTDGKIEISVASGVNFTVTATEDATLHFTAKTVE